MKVTFTANFDFEPAAYRGQVTVAYRQGQTYTVTRECAEKAVAAGKAVKVPASQAPEAEQ